jgi:hypothetical protein
MVSSEAGRDPGSEVAAVGEVVLISEHVDHEPVPYLCYLAVTQTLLGGRPGKPESG